MVTDSWLTPPCSASTLLTRCLRYPHCTQARYTNHRVITHLKAITIILRNFLGKLFTIFHFHFHISLGNYTNLDKACSFHSTYLITPVFLYPLFFSHSIQMKIVAVLKMNALLKPFSLKINTLSNWCIIHDS